MQYLLINLSTPVSSVIETLVDDTILKDIPFGRKFKTPSLSYENILIPFLIADQKDSDFILNYDNITSHVIQTNYFSYGDDVYYSLFKVFKELINKAKTFSFQVLDQISEEDIDLTYTDGSHSKNENKASYACCKLLTEDANGVLDDFTGKKWTYKPFSGVINDGTNNIGELTAIKVAIENLQSKKYQVIISDSIYSIKTYREYIHVWKNNGYKAYNKKDIKNKELIIDTYEKIKNAGDKIILFKWTKGHNNNSFNEICDELAKNELGIEK